MSDLRSQKQQRERLVRSLRAEGKSWVEVAEVLRQRYRVNARVAFRYAHCWSQRRVADEWNNRWPDELKTFKNFSCWEQWPGNTGHAPSFDNLSKLAQLYECAVSDLLVDLPDFRHLDIISSAQAAELSMLKPGTELALPMDSIRKPPEGSSVPTRREVFGYVGAGLTAIGLDQMSTVRQDGLSRVVQALTVTRQGVAAELEGLIRALFRSPAMITTGAS